MSIRIEFDSGKIADSKIARFKWRQAMANFLDEAQPKITDALKSEAPIAPQGVGRGRLRRSIKGRREIGADSATVRFTASAPYARYVLEGTRAHGPVRAQAMHWMVGSKHVYARWVKGVKPNRFPGRARAQVQSDVAERFRAAVRDAMK